MISLPLDLLVLLFYLALAAILWIEMPKGPK